jgi:dTDP-4-dehydrorhamnose 3,5-epimerase
VAQAKLVRVLRGSLFDVAVDIRPKSPSFGRWVSCVLSADAFNQLYVPEGFAHGFLTLEPDTEVLYKVSAPYAPECERSIAWNDPALAIAWPLREGQQPLLSAKDAVAARLEAMTSDLVF